MPEKLKPCPFCGDDGPVENDDRIGCSNNKCYALGPEDDFGPKWNALPRRTDASQGMDGFELVARAIVRLAIVTAVAHEVKQRRGDELFELDAELDRRAAARKESKP